MDAQDRRARREAQTTALRRRRRTAALGALTAALVAAVAVALSAGGSSPRGRPQAVASHAARKAGGTRTPASSAGTATGSSSGPPGSEPVPILMYHVIAAPPAGAPFPGLYVPPAEFSEEMHALKEAGWHAVTLDQVEANWKRGVSLGAGKPIVLSFDNGYQSQYTQALPVLQRLGWVGEENIQLSGLPPSQGGLLQRQIRGLVAAGWELDTQGFSHADLVTLDPEELHYQVAVSRQTLQRRFHVPVDWFCYPSGHYDATVIAAVKAAGYAGSTTVIPGWANREDDPYRLPRLRVLGGTSPQQLLSNIAAIREDPPAPASYTGG
ncbi:MAG TPA: polysaccharide deacetylase family protein [Solirubrobacteraceae bacterium]